ncbi:MAG: rRNA maturation RNase YbeY [Gemmatimonadetes bacterium]|nr:rRNA maturation RNase YbeY [Gemmatimonadota bacterium]MBT5058104.1 rRNA maturation RNase YbeY [Gemmatimonadota bacterium]MBT5142440.1 rRNA maturation RNase YbeY [Gemmatimonadota bacterium]MBT5586370.1 rRNA maturation RNase YbeY [Gemmatimonadota bacterium]MBT5961263.1 rRNA maturation RNase YbeY [Gemmatimonadota bacterium]
MAEPIHLHLPDDRPDLTATCVSEYLDVLGRSVLDAHPLTGTIEIVLTNDEELERLNSSFRGVSGPTDVLSFSLQEGQPLVVDESEERTAGEIYISVERAMEQAAALNVTLREELGRLMVHGLLHLAGYDHDTEETLRFMEGETEHFLQRHDVPDTRPVTSDER